MLLLPGMDAFLVNANKSFKVLKIYLDCFEMQKEKRQSAIGYHVMKHCLTSEKPEESQACIQYLKDEMFALKMMNALSFMAFQGKSLPIQECMDANIYYAPVDVDGMSPFDYCLKASNYWGVARIMKRLRESEAELSMSAFLFALGRPSLPEASELLEAGLFTPSPRLSDVPWPMKGRLRDGKEMSMFLDGARQLHTDLLSKHVDFESTKGKLIECHSSRIALNLHPGSRESTKFLEQLLDADEAALSSSSLHQFIEFKWDKINESNQALVLPCLYILAAVVHSVLIQSEHNTALVFLHLASLGFEIFQIICATKRGTDEEMKGARHMKTWSESPFSSLRE